MFELQGHLALLIPSLLGLLSYAVWQQRKKQSVPYPPGPPSAPIIGNALDLPFKKPWKGYYEWSKKLNSDIVHMCALGQHIVVLHKMEDAIALMDKRSGTYSSRPLVPIFELLGVESLTALTPYGETWRRHRKIAKEVLKKEMIPAYFEVQEDKVHLLLGQLLDFPRDFQDLFKALATAITMAVAFDYDVMPGEKHDRFVDLAETAGKAVAELTIPGRTLINIIPVLKYIPPWVPGASTQRFAASVKETMKQYRDEPFDYVRKNMDTGVSRKCLLASLLRRRELRGDGSLQEENDIKDTMATLYLAGVETLQSAQAIFALAMALYPQVQKKAQDEIDRVIGMDRLPTFQDRDSLPYVDAVYREVLRWRPVLPLGFAHSTVTDDVYKDYFIPKGTLVMANVWAMAKDEAVYTDPESFMPERYFNADGTLNDDTVPYAFGFGRRICPGRHLGGAALWLVIVSVLSTFNISKATDENGKEIEIDPDAFSDAFVSHALPFKCNIVPRSQRAEKLVRASADSAQRSLRVSSQ